MRDLIRVERILRISSHGKHRVEEVFDLIMPAQRRRNASPATHNREHRQNHKRQQHQPRRLMYAMMLRRLSIIVLSLERQRRG